MTITVGAVYHFIHVEALRSTNERYRYVRPNSNITGHVQVCVLDMVLHTCHFVALRERVCKL